MSLRLFRFTLSDRVVLSLLEQLPELEVLNLRGALVGDYFVSGLNLPKLKILSLDGTRITNNALPHVAQLSNLRELILRGTNLTDEGLLPLEQLDQLESVMLDRTRVTDEGIERLKQTLPNCRINH